MEMDKFENKVAIVTGGASGIGKSICVYLASHGAKVIIADHSLYESKVVESSITSNNRCYSKAVYVDVSNPEDVKSLIENTVKEHGQIDYLFNNAGISMNGEFQDLNLRHWKHVLDVNLCGVIYGCHFVYPIMRKQGFGHIINTASLAGLIPGGLTTIYSASKHAVVGFSLTLRGEAKQYGIKVSAFCPGYIRTNIQKTTLQVSEFMNSGKNKEMEANMNFPTPEDCIDQIMIGVKKNRGIIFSPKKQLIYWWLHRLFPELIPNIWDKMIRHMKKNI
jgi:NAD(P)-dependent dehydrogenase (short-subunit alcohol dehydrogenase family)